MNTNKRSPPTGGPFSTPQSFDSSLFLLDTDADTTLSEPFRAALPGPSSTTQTLSPPPAPGSVRKSVTPGAGGSEHSYSILSPDTSYLDPLASSPLEVDDISGNTTPGFETLGDIDIPDFNPDGDQSMFAPLHPEGASQESGYLITPGPTDHSSPVVQRSPIVKIEDHTPEGWSPHQQQSSSSSSSGLVQESVAITRADDGSWRGGLEPSARGGEMLPYSLKDQEIEMKKREKNAEVEEWLRRSSVQLPRRAEGGLAAPRQPRRRARSEASLRPTQEFINGQPVGPAEPAGQAVVDDDDDYTDDDYSVSSGWVEGSLDDEDPQPPASEEELKKAQMEEEEKERREREQNPEFLPASRQFLARHPWVDLVAPVARGATMEYRGQPNCANAAIEKFRKCADNIETASRSATFGSNMTKGRRNSAGDADKILGGPLKRLSFGKDKDKDKSKGSPTGSGRKYSVWSGLKRSLSNSGSSDKNKTPEKTGVKRTNSGSTLAPAILGNTFGAPNLSVETNVRSALGQMASPLMAAGAGKHGATSPTSSRTSGVPGLIDRVRRSRSKSELHRQHIFGVVTSLVGPVLPTYTPDENGPESGALEKKFTFGEEAQKRGVAQAQKLLSPLDAHRLEDDEDEEMEDGPSFAPDGVNTPPKPQITPTYEGFVANVKLLTPKLADKLVERVAQEQCKRFKKLVDYRHKHLAAITASGACSNGAKCRKTVGAIGVGSDGTVGVNGHRGGASRDDNGYDSAEDFSPTSPADHPIAAAQFPRGVPTPPVSYLPAEFECPICFKTKKFAKPSDWTKHVHEDVHPFTCTFPECIEFKSFKRKADWVRHENERHRHLEWWTCNQPDCTHTCYRKDNFVQHLIREHKFPEPRVKSQRKGESQAGIQRVWQIVDSCHQETRKPPQSEPCRFCGATCATWKKLTVHLARHMEAISLPVLDLITDDAVVPATTRPRRQQRQEPKQTQQNQPQYSLSPPNQQHQRSRSNPPSFERPEVYAPVTQGYPVDTGYANGYATQQSRPSYTGYEPTQYVQPAYGYAVPQTTTYTLPSTTVGIPVQSQVPVYYQQQQQQQPQGMESWRM